MSKSDIIADLVNQKFNRLPKKGKPIVRSNGLREWTTLAGIVIERSDLANASEVPPLLVSKASETNYYELECIVLATGVKATPDDKLKQAQGLVLHDMHAEILVIRALNRLLLEEVDRVKNEVEYCSDLIQIRSSVNNQSPLGYMYEIRPGIKFHMYVSEIPCGDSSMEMTQLSGNNEEEWTDPIETLCSEGGEVLRGRAHFSSVGLVRTKPGRVDSQLTLSKSCSDKLSLKQFTSLLSGVTAFIISPCGFYLTSLVLPELGFNEESCKRAFGSKGRLKDLSPKNKCMATHWDDDYQATFFQFESTVEKFVFARQPNSKTSNTSIVYIRDLGSEVILNGVKMGYKPFSGKGGSFICRSMMIQKLVHALQNPQNTSFPNMDLQSVLQYSDIKSRWLSRQMVKQDVYTVLKGWKRTSSDDFIIDFI
ncbi:hypothetical protein NADFUDRAFT_79252 [Nadsonia fulvescens var. elongata DSM 6958]|uniref:A to I editase domain-containing protein n=1 Tax=Nadsonia fulvescens var. elongata DSM 6958 TaxID=857566 RepID=A0A1E3PK90_9ASCO|nr:hypothetical protein NADFUDRAFT_79252 [Nadsonia fulvescens var. elongata DSM 6958]